jgi:adenine-specific DNA-methyltransferase
MATDSRKAQGTHYTPPDLADFLAESLLQRLKPPPRGPLILLDPACGDGALLAACAKALPADLRRRVRWLGYETDPEAAARARRTVPGAQIETADFLEAASGGLDLFQAAVPQVDAVIANPPYVRTQVLGAERAQALARRFGLTGRVDLYHAFFLAVAAVLKPGGTAALLTSNRFLTVQAGAAVRKLLGEAFDVRSVVDLGDTRLFDAAVLPAITVAVRRLPGRTSKSPTSFVRVYEERTERASRSRRSASALEALRRGWTGGIRTPAGRFCIERGAVRPGAAGQPWVFSTSSGDAWLAHIGRASAGVFGDVAEIRVGIKSTADAVFIRDEWEGVEAPLLRPLLTHHQAARWAAAPGPRPRVLYPHEVVEGRRRAVALEDYPGARAYLESHRGRLESRGYVAKAGRRWYELWVPQDPEAWAAPKIVWPDIAEGPRFFLDRSGAVVNGDCYWMSLKPGQDPRWLPLLLAVANSALATRLYDLRFHNRLYAGRRRYMTQYVREFPRPHLDAPGVPELLSRIEALSSEALETRDLDDCVAALFGVS